MANELIINEDSMLTTIDNPYSPYTEYDKWLQYDTAKGYNTNGYLARILRTSSELSDTLQDSDINNAMLQIIQENVYGVHRIINRNDKIETNL